MINQPESVVRETFGAPTEIYQLMDGTHRWIYLRQPLGYEVYTADSDINGKLINYRQMLTEREIYEARPGVWSKRDVLEHFGTLKEPTQCYLLMRREAWLYRVYVVGIQQVYFDALFDDNGVLDRTMIVVDPFGGDRRSCK